MTFFFSSRRRHTRWPRDWSSDVCSSDLFVPSSEVIGIARDVRSMDLRRIDESYIYLPLSQRRQWTGTLLVRTDGDPRQLLPATEIGRASCRERVESWVAAVCGTTKRTAA